MDADPMTDAELRVVREWLGLTGDDLAAALGVQGRTVRRWEAGTHPIPGSVREEIEALEQVAAEQVGVLVDQLNDAADARLVIPRTDDEARQMGHAQPAGWWRAIAARVAHEVPGLAIIYG